jgi:predicted phosphodiesterase
MSLTEDLSKLGEEESYKKKVNEHPKGFEAGVSWDGTSGWIVTEPMTAPPADWKQILAIWNLPTDGTVEIIEPIQMRAWDTQTKEGVQRMFYYKINVRSTISTIKNNELLKVIESWKLPKKLAPAQASGDMSFVVNYADLQIGKMDGDGSEGIITRVLEKTDKAVERLKQLRKSGSQINSIYLPQLGDCIEGFNSQGGRNAFRNDLDLTQQIRVYRRLLLHVVKTFTPLADKVIVPCIPGNHDEAVRIGNKMATTSTDSFNLDAASAVAEAVQLWGADHVSFVFPKYDTLTLTLDISGVIVGMIHGHQTRNRTINWWAQQAHGMHPIGDASILLSGHYHHLNILQSGAKTWIQMPALDGGSQWFEDRTGLNAPTGLVSFTIADNKWDNLIVL